MTAEVCVVDTGGAVLVVDAVTVATDAGVMVVVVDPREVDFSGDGVAMVTDSDAGVVAVTGGVVLSVFSAVLGGAEEEEVRTSEGAAVEGVVTPAGVDEAAEAFFASAGVAALVDGVVGGGVQTGLDAEGFSGSTCS